MLQTTLYLPRELADQINRLALSMGKPKAQVIRDALIHGLQVIEPLPSKSAQALLKLAQVGGKGPTDLAQHHNDYIWK